jgi:tetratricopeptide (TPR) repeat protein
MKGGNVLLIAIACVWATESDCQLKQSRGSIGSVDSIASAHNLMLGLSVYKVKKYPDALAYFKIAIAKNPNNWRAFRAKGNTERKLKKYQDAISSYSSALLINRNDTSSYKGRAESKRMNGDYENSLEDYTIALDWDPRDVDIRFGRGSTYYGLKKYIASIEDFTLCIKSDPKDPLLYMKRALSYVAIDRFSEGKRDLKKYFELGGKDDGVYYYTGLIGVYTGDNNMPRIDSAIADLKKYTASKNPINASDPWGYQMLAMAYGKKGDSSNANTNFKKSLDLEPGNLTTLFRWGTSELNFRHYKRANDLLGMVAKKEKNPTAFVFKHYALAKLGLGDTAQAIALFDKALAIDSLQEIYKSRMESLIGNNKYNHFVIRDLDHLISLERNDQIKSEFYFDKSLLNIKAHDTTIALRNIDLAIRLAPEDPRNYLCRAYINIFLNKSRTVVLADLDLAIQIDPAKSEPLMFKALYLATRGDHKNACEALKKIHRDEVPVTEDLMNYICKGKIPKNGKVPELTISLSPRSNLNPVLD